MPIDNPVVVCGLHAKRFGRVAEEIDDCLETRKSSRSCKFVLTIFANGQN